MKEKTKDELEREHYINTPGKIALHKFRRQFDFRINYGMADIEIDSLIEGTKKGEIIIDWNVFLPSKGKNLQRGFIWTLKQQQELILSVLKGITIAPITVIQYRDDRKQIQEKVTTYKIIDGKQRLSTLIRYVNNIFPITYRGFDIFFTKLTIQAQREITQCIRANIAYEYHDAMISDDDKIAWFEMINFAGTPQDKKHLDYLKSPFINLIEPFEVIDALRGSISGNYERDIKKLNKDNKTCSERVYQEAYQMDQQQ
jgi:hypothetical protein